MSATGSAVLVPVKSFDLAKGRLGSALAPGQRASLARSMASTVLSATGDLPAWVVCGDPDVAGFATRHGANVLWRPPQGLNTAVSEGRDFLAGLGFERVIVAHADLPRARDLTWLAETDGITIVPDRRNDGSNVMSLPTEIEFVFAYGPGSAAAHRAEAARLGVEVRMVEHDELGWDIDLPEDLDGIQLPDEWAPDPTPAPSDRSEPT